jgi:hypothetical protein
MGRRRRSRTSTATVVVSVQPGGFGLSLVNRGFCHHRAPGDVIELLDGRGALLFEPQQRPAVAAGTSGSSVRHSALAVPKSSWWFSHM